MTQHSDITIAWFRQDLRLADNPALNAAAVRGTVVPVYIWAPEEEAPWSPGAASRWWLHHSLDSLRREFEAKGLRLVIRQGPSLDTLRALAKETGASAVFWNRRYEPAVIKRDKDIRAKLQKDGLETASFNGALLLEPHRIATKEGNPYQVFTPFYKAALAGKEPETPLGVPKNLRGPEAWPKSVALDNLELLPQIDWAGGLRETWSPGTAGAQAELDRFLENALADYPTLRDRPAVIGTSRMSPYLHHGELSPRQVLQAVEEFSAAEPSAGKGAETYIRQLYWREFGHHLLYHFPHTPDQALREKFRDFPWAKDKAALKAWQQGHTGYPLIDAGMRELWHTGWMHNRVRMNVASFLVKHLLLPWQEGARWFWDTLVDADLANNTLGWQWAAGCGADAAPYFRIFNPILQSKKFDPGGNYLRQYVTEISGFSGSHIHAPWEAPQQAFAGAGITPGKDYPEPIVGHKTARERALAAFEQVKGQQGH
ncbi:MAG: cryptochrome/photolyase family protein [Candidatus Hydrogenedentota bacterium]